MESFIYYKNLLEIALNFFFSKALGSPQNECKYVLSAT